jgi:hypothetical protein
MLFCPPVSEFAQRRYTVFSSLGCPPVVTNRSEAGTAPNPRPPLGLP